MKARLHIERLVIDGASRADAKRIADALRNSFSELPALRPPASNVRIARLNAGALSHPASAGQIGRRIAGKVMASLKGPHA